MIQQPTNKIYKKLSALPNSVANSNMEQDATFYLYSIL